MKSRYEWLEERIKSCVEEIGKIDLTNGFDEYCAKAKDLAEELLYATGEWNKYYEGE